MLLNLNSVRIQRCAYFTFNIDQIKRLFAERIYTTYKVHLKKFFPGISKKIKIMEKINFSLYFVASNISQRNILVYNYEVYIYAHKCSLKH